MDFDTVFQRSVLIEAGYSNNEKDPGGETNLGVTWPVLKQAITDGIVPAGTTIKGLTRDQAHAIYFRYFWQAGHFDELDGAIAFQAFDFAINSSIETALRKLQRAVGVADDGHFGPVTLAAVKAMSVPDVIMRYVAERIDFWTSLSTWAAFGKGWARRAAADLRYGAVDA